MLRQGKADIVFSGSVTWSAGATYTSNQTLAFSIPASAGLTTLLHEVIFQTNHTGSITVDIRPVQTIGGSTVYGDLGLSITISGVTTVKGLSVSAVNTEIRGLCNNASGMFAFLFTTTSTAALSAAISVNCIVQELEGT